MRVFQSFKNIHKWVSIFIALPLLVILITGILINLSPKFNWLQPQASKPKAPALKLSIDQAFDIAKAQKAAGITSWNDITVIEVRPATGVMRVRTKGYWEIQIDASTGEVLSSGKRVKGLLIYMHEGNWFGDWVRYFVFLPASIGALVLLFTGLVLFFTPILRRRKV